MPVQTTVYPQGRLLITVVDGDAQEQELANDFASVPSLPGFSPLFDHFLDFSKASRMTIAATTVQRFAYQSFLSPTSRRALLANNDVVYGMCRLFEAHCHGAGFQHVLVTRDRKTALSWLGLSET